MKNSAFDVRPAFLSELTYYYLTLAECGRCSTLIHPNEWNLTVRRKGSSNHHIFVSRLEPSTPRTASEHPNHSRTELATAMLNSI